MPSGRRLLKASGLLTNTLTDDGSMFLNISDHDNAAGLQSVVRYATRNGSGYNEGKILYNTESATLADSDVGTNACIVGASMGAWRKRASRSLTKGSFLVY